MAGAAGRELGHPGGFRAETTCSHSFHWMDRPNIHLQLELPIFQLCVLFPLDLCGLKVAAHRWQKAINIKEKLYAILDPNFLEIYVILTSTVLLYKNPGI